MYRLQKITYFFFITTILLTSCATASSPTPTSTPQNTPTITPTQPRQIPTATFTPTPQSTSTPVTFGPDSFPANVNPLTGQPVADPSLLKIPAMLVSISNFPATARPQAGLSFAPYVFQFSITQGDDRFMTIFYGEWPHPEVPVTGGCEVRQGAFTKTGILLGRRVWLDTNRNGILDPGENGVGGVCVNLYDANGNLIQQTTTDSNGYYGFNVQSGDYRIEFVKPNGMEFTRPNVGDDSHDSDVNPSDGKTPLIHVTGDDLSWDAGLTVSPDAPTPSGTSTPLPEAAIGPVRSGRLLYAYIANFFPDSCLIDAFASPEVLVKIPKCAFVAHDTVGGGNMLDLQRFQAIAAKSEKISDSKFNYTSNLYADQPPSGGLPASQLNVFYAYQNQSGWTYDPISQSWLRSTDTSDISQAGILHLDTDRLNGRQLHFENVVVVMADTDVVSPTNIDIHLDEGNTGYAFLFRDGLMYKIRWSTLATKYEQKTGFERPIKFINTDGSPAPLKPGHTWVIIVTPFSYFAEQQSGVYLVRYVPPQGEAR